MDSVKVSGKSNDILSLLFAQLENVNVVKGEGNGISGFDQLLSSLEKMKPSNEDDFNINQQTVQNQEENSTPKDVTAYIAEMLQKIGDIEKTINKLDGSSELKQNWGTVKDFLMDKLNELPINQTHKQEIEKEVNQSIQMLVSMLTKEKGIDTSNLVDKKMTAVDGIESKRTKESEEASKETKEKKSSDEKNVNNWVEQLSAIWKTSIVFKEENHPSNQLLKENNGQLDSTVNSDVKGNKEAILSFQQNEIQQLKKGIINLNQALKEAGNTEKKESDKDNTIVAEIDQQFDKSFDSTKKIQNLPNFESNLKEMLSKQVIEPSANFKLVNPEKIVLHLKPEELGSVEVIIEKVNGEIQVKMKSENEDVQRLLDRMVDEIKGELQDNQPTEMHQEQTFEKEQDEKTKEHPIVTKNEEDEIEENTVLFDEELNRLIGGYRYGS